MPGRRHIVEEDVFVAAVQEAVALGVHLNQPVLVAVWTSYDLVAGCGTASAIAFSSFSYSTGGSLLRHNALICESLDCGVFQVAVVCIQLLGCCGHRLVLRLPS